MQLLIDADACPVVDAAIKAAVKRQIPVTLVCDDAHEMKREGAQTITVLRGADSADFRLVNLLKPRGVVVTQDYGLAALCLAKGARVLDQNGRIYDEKNIDGLLYLRYMGQKIRRQGGRTKGPAKRTRQQDEAFTESLTKLLDQ